MTYVAQKVSEREPARQRYVWFAAMALLCSTFGIVASLVRPYFSNQNTYFVHAALESGRFPGLARDWLASTADSTPLFTFLGATIIAQLGAYGLVLANALLGALFVGGLILCAEAILSVGGNPIVRFLAMATIIVLWFAFPSPVRSVVFDGVADQYLFRGFLQPSSFGVLFVWALWGFASGRKTLGIAAAVLAVSMNPSYLITYVGVLVAAEFLMHPSRGTLLRRAVRGPLFIGTIAVVPLVSLSYSRFSPSDALSFAEACRILADERIPHHAHPAAWVSWSLLPKAVIVGFAVRVAPSRGARALLGMLGVGVTLSLVAIGAGAPALLLTFPWRLSSVLVPVSTAVVVVWACARVSSFAARRCALAMALLSAVLLANATGSGYRRMLRAPTPELALIAALRSELNVEHGVGRLLIHPDWEEVRLNAAAPIFVDWKSHPYRDLDVLEWWRRVRLARAFYGPSESARCSVLDEIRRVDPDVRWVVAPADFRLDCPNVQPIAAGTRRAFRINDRAIVTTH